MRNVGYFVRLTRRIHQRDEGFNLVFLKLKTKFSALKNIVNLIILVNERTFSQSFSM